MAIFAYTGLMGHGKTYQVVSEVVVEKYKQGYNIKTNISGLNEEEIRKYILKYNKDYDPQNFGTIEFFDEDSPRQDGFFPTEKEVQDEETKEVKKVVIDGVVKSGDLIIVDEAWQYWDTGFKFPQNHIHFFRYMRHFVNDKGHTSDLVIITQDISTIDRQLKKLVEMTYHTVKPKMLTSSMYNLTIYQGSSLSRRNQISHGSIPKKYDPEIFPLYKSYTKENANESLIDDRIVFWKSKSFIGSIVAFVFLVFLGFYLLYSYFGKYYKKEPVKDSQKQEQQVQGKGTDTQKGTSAPIGTIPSSVPISPQPTTDKKISVLFYRGNTLIVGVKGQEKESKTEYFFNPDCSGFGRFITCNIDKKKISF